MQQLEIINVRQSNKNPQNVNVQFRGSIKRSLLPTNFVGESTNTNVLLARALGLDNNDTFTFTVWFTFNKDVFAKHCTKDKNNNIVFPTDINALFDIKAGEGNVVAVIARTTFKDPSATDIKPVVNPKTGEVKTFEGLDVYQYATLGQSKDGHCAMFLGHDKPTWIKLETVDVQAEVVTNAFA